jgi:hypothetical protein
MEMEITQYLVNFAQNSTSIEVLHTTSGAFGEDKRKDTVVVRRIEAWTIESLQAAVLEAANTVRAEKAAAAATSEQTTATKFQIPLAVVK